MRYLKENKGITIIALVIMIIVILILAGISLIEGTSLIKQTKIENLMTNMITIRAKSKVFAEEVNAEVWDVEDKSTKRQNLYSEKYSMSVPSNETELISKVDSSVNTGNSCECYEITKETLSVMGLDELVNETENGEYIVVYDSSDYTNLDIIYQPGIQYKGETYYTLSSLQAEMGE